MGLKVAFFGGSRFLVVPCHSGLSEFRCFVGMFAVSGATPQITRLVCAVRIALSTAVSRMLGAWVLPSKVLKDRWMMPKPSMENKWNVVRVSY